jgi:hypothetical protein
MLSAYNAEAGVVALSSRKREAVSGCSNRIHKLPADFPNTTEDRPGVRNQLIAIEDSGWQR